MTPPSNVRSALRALFARSQRLLLVGARSFGLGGALEVSGLDALPPRGERFDGALWCPDVDPTRGLRLLRAHVRPGAHIALWGVPTGFMAQVWSSVSRAPARTALQLEQACEALVLAGLCAPQVVAVGSLGFAVVGSLPVRRDPLDAFFEQPAP